MTRICMTFWGSHGCMLPKGHDGQHRCDCCEPDDAHRDAHARASATRPPEMESGWVCVGTWPYYGPATAFFGEDGLDLPGEWARLAALRDEDA